MLKLNHVVNTVVIVVNFIRARGLQHCQFILFLEKTDADHQDLLYRCRVSWFGKSVSMRVGAQRGDQHIFELGGKSDEFPELSDKN